MAYRGAIWVLCAASLLTQIACGREHSDATPTVRSTPAAQRVITIGKVSDKPAGIIEEYQPVADHLAACIDDFDIGWVQVAGDLETMAQWLASGKVDIYFDNLFASMVVADLSDGRPLVMRVKEGAAAKYSVFFTLADSGITSLADLQGRIIAMEEPGSTVSFLAAVAHLIDLGLNPVEKTGPAGFVAENEVGYVFSRADVNTMQWVLSNRVPAGVAKIKVFSEFAEANPDTLVALGQTEAVTRDQPGVVRPGMEVSLERAIVAALLDLSEGNSGRDILASARTTRFSEISPDTEAEIARVRQMYELVREK